MTQVVVQDDMPGVTIESVEKLYQRHARMDVPGYYEDGQENPWAGLCRVIPAKATAYALIPVDDLPRIAMAQAMLKGLVKRRKVWFAIRHKAEINYQMFAPAGKIAVLYV